MALLQIVRDQAVLKLKILGNQSQWYAGADAYFAVTATTGDSVAKSIT
jgi:hypothetical protein